MAIRWQCFGCQRTLSIASRKGGTTIECPSCKQAQTVPIEEVANIRPPRAPFADLSPAVPLPAPARWQSGSGVSGMLVMAGVVVVVLAGVIASTIWLSHASDFAAADDSEPASHEPAVAALPPRAELEEVRPAVATPTVQAPAPELVKTPPTEPVSQPEQAAPSKATQPPPLNVDRPEERQPPRGASAPKPPEIKERVRLSADELVQQLSQVPELDFYPEMDQLRKQLLDAAVKKMGGKNLADDTALRAKLALTAPAGFRERVNDMLLEKAKAEGVPVLRGTACRVDMDTAKNMGYISTTLRTRGFVSTPTAVNGRRGVVITKNDPARVDLLQEWCDANKVEKYNGGASTLLQMLQVEEVECRLLLVRELGKINNQGASAALARLALYDTSDQVRDACLAVLRTRRPEQYRQVFLNGLRYPWAPAADHAADALVILKDKKAVQPLVKLLDQPDPSLPVREKDNLVVHELVRINHMRNCYLCHAMAASTQAPGTDPRTGRRIFLIGGAIDLPEEPVRGRVPTVGQALPVAYYADRGAGAGEFARADITYVRQDFSVPMSVKDANPWPDVQRYDYLVRTRKATDEEAAALAKQSAMSSYPQREAVLYALRELTGKDVGTTAEDWQKLAAAE